MDCSENITVRSSDDVLIEHCEDITVRSSDDVLIEHCEDITGRLVKCSGEMFLDYSQAFPREHHEDITRRCP